MTPECLQIAQRKIAEGYLVTLIPGRHDGDPCVHVRWVTQPRSFHAQRLLRSPFPTARAALLILIAAEARRAAARRGVVS